MPAAGAGAQNEVVSINAEVVYGVFMSTIYISQIWAGVSTFSAGLLVARGSRSLLSSLFFINLVIKMLQRYVSDCIGSKRKPLFCPGKSQIPG
jgi:hypothetical protein